MGIREREGGRGGVIEREREREREREFKQEREKRKLKEGREDWRE